ncbi:MAG: hypothetical protein WAK95_06150, partial [Desulfobacterales bacterium]
VFISGSLCHIKQPPRYPTRNPSSSGMNYQSLLEPRKTKPAMESAVDVTAIRTPVGKLHGRLKNIDTRDLIAAGQLGKGAA